MTDRFILKIDPPQPFQGLYPNEAGDEVRCTLLTGMAEASWGENAGGYAPELSVDPYCWRHLWIGFPDPTPEELEFEHLCMTNFVVNHFSGKGTAQVLGPCPTDSIPPPYEPWEDDDMIDEAYSATYRDEQGQERHVCAVYLVWENCWELFEFAQSRVECTQK